MLSDTRCKASIQKDSTMMDCTDEYPPEFEERKQSSFKSVLTMPRNQVTLDNPLGHQAKQAPHMERSDIGGKPPRQTIVLEASAYVQPRTDLRKHKVKVLNSPIDPPQTIILNVPNTTHEEQLKFVRDSVSDLYKAFDHLASGCCSTSLSPRRTITYTPRSKNLKCQGIFTTSRNNAVKFAGQAWELKRGEDIIFVYEIRSRGFGSRDALAEFVMFCATELSNRDRADRFASGVKIAYPEAMEPASDEENLGELSMPSMGYTGSSGRTRPPPNITSSCDWESHLQSKHFPLHRNALAMLADACSDKENVKAMQENDSVMTAVCDQHNVQDHSAVLNALVIVLSIAQLGNAKSIKALIDNGAERMALSALRNENIMSPRLQQLAASTVKVLGAQSDAPSLKNESWHYGGPKEFLMQ